MSKPHQRDTYTSARPLLNHRVKSAWRGPLGSFVDCWDLKLILKKRGEENRRIDYKPGSHSRKKKCQNLIIRLHSTREEKWVSFHICCKWAKESFSKVRKNCERLVHQSNGNNSAAATGFVKLTINQKKSSLFWEKLVSKKK